MPKKEFAMLGELENKIMEAVWRLGQATVRDVLKHMKGAKKPAYTTVMTVMTRLYNKGVLKRQFKNEAYIYSPVQDKQAFFESLSKKVIHNLINKFGEDVAVAGFIDVIEKTDINKSRELRKKLKKIIK